MRRLTARGYALWDIVAESERKGSLDGDIKNATFADVQASYHPTLLPSYHLTILLSYHPTILPSYVQALVARHPSIRRICFSSGGTTAKFFRRTHKAWLATLTLTLALTLTPARTLTLTLTLTRRGSPRPVPSSRVPTALRRALSSPSGG